jgi:O-antigen/teichoic acid export membrane protein
VQLVVLLCGGGTLCLIAAAFLIPSPFVAIPIAIPFFLSPVANAVLLAVMFRQTPQEYLGRVNNALIQVATGLAVLSPLAAGLLVEYLSPHGAMAVFAVGLAVCLVIGLSLKGLREVGRLGAETT